MRRLRDDADPGAFLRRAREADHRILLLDYDGTLAPFREERDEAVPYEGVREALGVLIGDARNRVVVISGRAIRDLAPLLGLERTPELWGSHGLEHLGPRGDYESVELEDEAARALEEARRWAEEEGMEARAERKTGCLAFHLRGLEPEAAERWRRRARERFEALAGPSRLAVHEFDGGVELRVPARDKGHAVRDVLADAPEGTPVAYLGDDLTDEDAFVALEGRGLRVLVRDELRPTRADLWLRPPEELLGFLRAWGRSADLPGDGDGRDDPDGRGGGGSGAEGRGRGRG